MENRDIHVNFKDPQAVQWKFVPPISGDPYLKTITARSGDFNMDGFPDLIMTLQTVDENRMQTFLMENVPCRMCNKPLKRTFEVKWNALNPMGNDTVAGAFYDFYQDGKFCCFYLYCFHKLYPKKFCNLRIKVNSILVFLVLFVNI